MRIARYTAEGLGLCSVCEASPFAAIWSDDQFPFPHNQRTNVPCCSKVVATRTSHRKPCQAVVKHDFCAHGDIILAKNDIPLRHAIVGYDCRHRIREGCNRGTGCDP